MIYTKTNTYHDLFNRDLFKNLEEANFEKESIYWHDRHDKVLRNTPFDSFINTSHWEHLRRDPTSKILMFYGDEYYNCLDIDEWVSTLKKWNIPPQQLFIVCLDKNWVTWTRDRFADREYDGVNVQDYNLLMSKVSPQDDKVITKRFSALSRNYTKWRLEFYASLFNAHLLDHFNYTFNNIQPYGKVNIYSHNTVKDDLGKLGFALTSGLEKWVDGMPYTLTGNRIQLKFTADIYEIIQTSAINIVIESHFDPYWNFKGHKWMNPQLFSPSFPTEKMYKPIACQRPFIVFSTPFFLKEFKTLGYKTFEPYINENYDSIIDNSERLQAIITELLRLSNLSDNEFKNVINGCKEIAEHNFNLMENLKKDVWFKEEFSWVTQYVETRSCRIPKAIEG